MAAAAPITGYAGRGRPVSIINVNLKQVISF